MKRFVFYNPTKIVFGKHETENIGAYIKESPCLLLYGKGSIKQNGIYDRVVNSLKKNNIRFIELGGVKSNPVLSFVYSAIEIVKKEKLNSILAVGGGSVIDTAKAISAGAMYNGDVWDFFIDKARIENALPIYTVLTLSATASEMNSGAVITNEKTQQKFNINATVLFPRVSVLDPVNTYTVSKEYTAYGCVDAIVHLLEGYFTQEDPHTPIQDSFVESLIKTLMESTREILNNPQDYEARANFMWSATLALNGLTTAGIGRYGFPNHMMGHSLSALYDTPHGASLSIVLIGWLKYQIQLGNYKKIAQLGKAVFGITGNNEELSAKDTVKAFADFFTFIGSPITLQQLNIPHSDIDKIASNAVMLAEKWGLNAYTQSVIKDIFKLCY
ncbi:MAG: iron-containing alcohol dehydrogenase [bacterium]